MIFRVETTPAAEGEAQAILEWLLDEQSGEAALRWFLNLEQAIQSLSYFPERYVSLARENERFPFEVRQLLYGRRPHVYRILITIEQGMVYGPSQ